MKLLYGLISRNQNMLKPEHYIRQTGLINPMLLDIPIVVVGAGGIGSWTCLALGKLGCQNVTVIDFDKVEIHNIGSQFYTDGDLGEFKVKALEERLFGLLDNAPKGKVGQIKEGAMEVLKGAKIVISAVDNIEVRRWIFEGLKGEDSILIDGRMAGNTIHLMCAPLNNEESIKGYEATLFPPEEAIQENCTERAVVYNCFVMAGLITDLVARLASKKEVPTEMVIDLANFTMEN